MSFKVGDNIVYAGSGVCQIDAIKDISFFKEKPQKYYVLKPLFVRQSQVVYVPLENQAQVDKIRPVLSKKEAMALIDKIPYNKLEWIEDRNDRKDAFADIIVNGSREDIMSMIHLIKCHAKKLSGEGKHLNAQDERALNDARVRMNNEIALALDIEPENVVELIQEKTGEVDFA